jgi:uncharacterized protein
MKFTQDSPGSELVFSNYDDHSVTINEQKLISSLIVFPDHLQRDWPTSDVSELTIEHFALVMERRPDIVILGTGTTQQFPTLTLRRELAANQLQLEVMNNAAACRTYNLLVSEDRDVAAAIIIAE